MCIKVSGYRLGTAEIESALVSHPSVAEAAAIGLPHEVKGNAIHTYVMLKSGVEKSDKLIEELRAHVAHEMGPIAKPDSIQFVDVASEDAERQDHAPRSEGAGSRAGTEGHHHAGGVDGASRFHFSAAKLRILNHLWMSVLILDDLLQVLLPLLLRGSRGAVWHHVLQECSVAGAGQASGIDRRHRPPPGVSGGPHGCSSIIRPSRRCSRS